MHPTLVELKADRNLLDPSFDGYKLSLDVIPIYRKELETGVDNLQPSENLFSFLHIKVFSLHNHLYVNQHCPDQVYFIDKKWRIMQVMLTPLSRVEGFAQVGEIPSNHERKGGDYNISVAFADPNSVVLSDGAGTLHFAHVHADGKWQVTHSDMVATEGVKFVIHDAKINVQDERKYAHVVVLYVEEKKKEDQENKTSCQSCLEWYRFEQDQNQAWSKLSEKKIACNGSIDYVALEKDCKSLLVVSDRVPVFVFDSEKPVVTKVEPEPVKKEYVWAQTEESVSLTLPLADNVTEGDVGVVVEEGVKLEVKVKEAVVLCGELSNRVDGTSWSLGKGGLDVELTKGERGLMWHQVVVGDERGELVLDPALVREVHERLSHLCSEHPEGAQSAVLNSTQLEECDSVACDTAALYRLDGDLHRASHEVSLSAMPWLFKVHRDPSLPPALCLRLDVDACVWQFEPALDRTFPYTHAATFSAFGYVQASKTQKKFMASPPDCSYVAVCETARHIYIYRQPSAVSGELRNRTSGRRVLSVAKQQLVNLESGDEILGVHATNALLYILTATTLHLLVINE